MASPAPEAVASQDTKPQDTVPAKEVPAGLNGHAAPVVEAKPQSELEPPVPTEKPATNGDKDAENHEQSNGVTSEDVEMKTDEKVEVAGVEEAKEPKTDEPAKPEAKPDEPSKEDDLAVAKAALADESADVEMTEASPTESNALPIQDKADATSSFDAPAAPVGPADESQKAAQPKDEAIDEVKDEKDISAATESKAEEAKATEKSDAPATETPAPSATEAELQPASLSQLAIEPKEKESSPVQQSVEVSMTDASSSKVARERDEDVEGEPAPKRAKTEPKEGEGEGEADVEAETPFAAPEESEVAPSEPPSFADFPRWNDADDNARIITPFQRRKIRAVIARVKKTKSGGNFRDSVQRLWPVLWDKYSAKIEKSMDLSEIERTLRDNEKTYTVFGEFKKDLGLILENAHSFNGPDHYVTQAARAATKAIWEDVYQVPEEEPVPAKPAPKTSRVRESRSANPPKAESTPKADTAAQPSSVTPSSQAAPAPAKPAQPAPESRRASTATDADRPKRTVRAPKSKDIDYSKSSRKKLKPELQFCEEVLHELMSQKHVTMNQWFLDPVDPVALGIPDYYSIIKHPMDLKQVQTMISNGEIASLKDFDKNVKLIFTNCYEFNGPPDPTSVSYYAKQLEDMYLSLMKNKDAWIAKHSKPAPPAASNATDDEEEDDDEDEGDEGSAGPDPSQEVKDLEARLREEMDKQTNLFAAEQPNESMIQIQQGIVNMVQEALLKAKSKLNEFRQKNGNAPKPSKKAAKAGKAKAASGASRKPGGGSSQAKKASGGAKKAKKSLNGAEKDLVANAINDLEYPHLDRAIEIIKRDTGSKESEDGELELDIDQLSTDALLKLWELLKKVLPNFGRDASGIASPEAVRGGGGGGNSKPAPKTAAKPKKNKPMSAQEQEARIAKLHQLSNMYKGGKQDGGDSAHSPQMHSADAESSDDSSEEE